MRFKVGDVVRLKSNGPAMTIDEIAGTQAHCVWFNGTVLSSGYFEMAALDVA